MNGGKQDSPRAGNPARNGAIDVAGLRGVLEAVAVGLPSDELPDFVGLLEATKARVMARLLSPVLPPVPTDDVVDVATLSAELGLARSWLRAQARAEKLPHLRCGKYIKFRRAEVLAALARSGADHRMGTPVDAEKPNSGEGSFPSVSRGKGAG